MSTTTPGIDPANTALFLDVDGTLLELRDDPASVSADAALVDLLDRCRDALDGAMALISGRTLAEIDRIFSPAVFHAAGSHGAEMRITGARENPAGGAALSAEIIGALERFAGQHDGLLVETKPAGAALHYRRAPEHQAAALEVAEGILADAGDAYRLIHGKMVYEIAPKMHDKGSAIDTLLELAPFRGRTAVFLGDDVTDEDGFREVNRREGLSIRVGPRDNSIARSTLPNVAAVRDWLEREILKQEMMQG